MTKMAAMPIYGENPSKIFFSGTIEPISAKLGMKHLCVYNSVMTLTYFYGKVNFGDIGMGKTEDYGFFENYCSL